MPDCPVVTTPDRALLGFVGALRSEGIRVPPAAAAAYLDAIALIDVADPAQAYWAGRATLLCHRADAYAYDRAFARHFAGPDRAAVPAAVPELVTPAAHELLPADADREAEPAGGPNPGAEAEPAGGPNAHAKRVPTPDRAVGDDHDGADPERADQTSDDSLDQALDQARDQSLDQARDQVPMRWSPSERLHDRDFAAFSADEIALADRWLDALDLQPPLRRTRRTRPARRGTSGPIDVRRTVAASLASDGELLRLHRRRRQVRPRPVVFLLDVSGSMEPYARMLLRVVHASMGAPRPSGPHGGKRGRSRVEGFVFGTRLTRVTRALAAADPDVALRAAAQAAADWSGGTRLGACLAAFNEGWGRDMARGAVVVILSDGWDRGDPAEVDRQMARLGRVAHRVVWVNPLKGTDGYAPLAKGMAAALPHVDEFVEGHSLAAVESLLEEIGR